MMRIVVVLGLLALVGCAEIKPGMPGHEPPSAGNINPVTGTRASGTR